MAAEFSAVDRDIRTTPGNAGFFVRDDRQPQSNWYNFRYNIIFLIC